MPDPIDVHVGSQVRRFRTLKGYSQERLGNELGLTFQQVQKYERGTNRIGASRLVRIALVLGVRPEQFFENMPEEITGFGRKGMADESVHFEVKPGYSKRETLEFVRCFKAITKENVRQKLFELIKAIEEAQDEISAELDRQEAESRGRHARK